MAIYHLSVKTISRSAGRSAPAAAAYRAAAEIAEERTGEVHDYRRRGGVVATALHLPDGAPPWAQDRASLWNQAEAAERRRNSTVAREIVVALPAELNEAQRADLTHELADEIVARHGCAVDVAIHTPGRQGDLRNHHAHLLLTTRRLEADGFTAKTRELDRRQSGEVGHWRARWAELSNAALERAGRRERIDHRTLADQGIEREPTKHLGPGATAVERKRGAASRRRQDHQVEAAARLAAARDAGALKRQAQAVEASILDLSGDLQAAIAAREKSQAREQARASRERALQALEQHVLWRLEPGKAEAEAERWVQFHMHKLRERTARLALRLEAARVRLEGRQREHAQETPSGLLRLLGRHGKAQEAHQARGEALARRERDLERRAGVLKHYQRPEVVRESAERWVDRTLPQLRELAGQEKARRIAERRAQLEREAKARRERERGRGGRGR